MKDRIKELEEQLSRLPNGSSVQSPPQTAISSLLTESSYLTGALHVHRESRFPGDRSFISRGVTHKARLFGQSHWINGVTVVSFLNLSYILYNLCLPNYQIGDLFQMIDSQPREEITKAFANIHKCKTLARAIKKQRAPSWPLPPTALPLKDVADELVGCYLRTMERIYRVLHIPTFKRDYEAIWLPGSEPDPSFIIQLKLVLAIGATVHDDQFSLRTSAIQWVYEGQIWISDPDFKSKLLNLRALQINILLLLAREMTGVGEHVNWVSAGALIRSAMFMGLHRDPEFLPKRSFFASEMRRRIWNTILEVCLQSSIAQGGPPLMSASDFDTKPPGNFDDDQLLAEDPSPRPESIRSDMSVAIALRKTFPLRLEITSFLNNVGTGGTYKETLRLDEKFKDALKTLRKSLQRAGDSNLRTAPTFEMRAVELIMYRYFLSLHMPFFSASLLGSSYAFSRKMVVDTSLKVWCAAYPTSSIIMTQEQGKTSPSDLTDDLSRLSICGSGFFRITPLQTSLVVSAEIKVQLQEEEGLCPVPLRSDLLTVIEEAKIRSLQCIEAGETNIKGYLLHALVIEHIEALTRGIEREKLPALLVKAAELAGGICLQILEAKAAQETLDALDHTSTSTPSHFLDGWDFMVSQTLSCPVDDYLLMVNSPRRPTRSLISIPWSR